MRVELAAKIAGLDVDEALVDEADDLDVVGRAHELDSPERARRDETRAAPGLRAPRDLLALGVGDRRVGVYGSTLR